MNTLWYSNEHNVLSLIGVMDVQDKYNKIKHPYVVPGIKVDTIYCCQEFFDLGFGHINTEWIY